MFPCAVALAAGALFLPRGEWVRTDCFQDGNYAVPERVSGAELLRTDDELVVKVWRRLALGGRAIARGKAYPPESMFAGGGETVEIFLAPGAPESREYYHFIANPSNELYQACGRDVSWRPAVPVRSTPFFEKDRWGVEFVVPFAALGVCPPVDGDRWRANFAAMNCSWARVSNYHDASQFGTVVFGGSPARARVESAAMDPDGTLHVSFEIPPSQAKGEIPHKSGARTNEVVLTDGGERIAGFMVQTERDDAKYLELDRYYYPGGESLRLEYFVKNVGVSTVCVRRLEDNEVVGEFRDAPPSGTVALGPLPKGEYAFEVHGRLARASCQFEVVGAEAVAWPGGPAYPVLGSEGLPSEHLSLARALSGRLLRKPAVGHLYDRLKPLYGAAGLLPKERSDGCIYRLAYEAQLAVMLRDGDEGEISFADDGPSFYAGVYRELKRAYPHLRFSIHLDRQHRVAEYARCCDVLEYAAPMFSYAHDLLAHAQRAIAEAKDAAGGRPVILWLGVGYPGNGRWRTAEELNTAIRLCVLKGIAGNVYHLGHGGVPASRTRLWSFMRGSERAVNEWYPDWARGTPARLEAEADDGIDFGLRRADDRLVLVAVNLNRCERTLRFLDPATSAPRLLRLPGYGSAVLRFRK